MKPTSQRVFILATLCGIWAGLVKAAPQHISTIHVRSGQAIQAAIDKAHRGDRIFVEPGTYAEQLTINKDGIDLIGHGATLVPPASPTQQNTCSGLSGNGTEAGICVTGSGVNLGPFPGIEHRKVISVDKPVRGVSITGFQVKGFAGQNIAVVGAQDTLVAGNKLVDGDVYGFLTAGSQNTRVDSNTIISTTTVRFIGLCMDDKGNVHVTNNRISGYGIGLCIETPGADVRQNEVSNGCIGAFVDPGVVGAKVLYNHISAPNPLCRTTASAFGIYGIVISGAVDTEVKYNLVEGMTNSTTPDEVATGIAVVDDGSTTPPSIASGNEITQNILRHNDLDILLYTNGTGNVATHNICSSSFPPGLCPGK